MKKTNTIRGNKLFAASAVALSLAAAGTASAATVIPLTANATGSSTAAFGSTLVGTVNDGFAYDPLNPTGALPYQIADDDLTQFFHANEAGAADITLNYTLTSFTTTAGEPTIVVDLYGRRDRSEASAEGQRDNNADILLLNGAAVVATVSGVLIDQDDSAWGRATFDSLPVGTTFDGIRLIGHESAGNATNYYTLAEIRTAAIAVPEPSSTALLGLGGLALILRRKK